MSLRALHGVSRADNLVCSSRPRYAHKDLVWWFGGRILPETITGGSPTNSVSVPRPRPYFCLLPFPPESSVLIIGAGLPSSCYGPVIKFCVDNGFSILGMAKMSFDDVVIQQLQAVLTTEKQAEKGVVLAERLGLRTEAGLVVQMEKETAVVSDIDSD